MENSEFKAKEDKNFGERTEDNVSDNKDCKEGAWETLEGIPCEEEASDKEAENIAEEASADLPVVSPVYGESQALTVTNSTENSKSATINGVDAQIPVKNINFKLSAKYNTGLPHYAFIQKDSPVAEIPNKALIIEYAAPISTRGNICNLGAMVYTLTSTTYQ